VNKIIAPDGNFRSCASTIIVIGPISLLNPGLFLLGVHSPDLSLRGIRCAPRGLADHYY
jgi:hypothetical protein